MDLGTAMALAAGWKEKPMSDTPELDRFFKGGFMTEGDLLLARQQAGMVARRRAAKNEKPLSKSKQAVLDMEADRARRKARFQAAHNEGEERRRREKEPPRYPRRVLEV